MPSRPSPLRRPLAAATGISLLASSLALAAGAFVPASAVSTGLVINEVYVNGGSAGATYTHKYVELQNRSGSAINLAGMSLQYRSPTGSGSSSTSVALTGTVAAGGYFTVQGGTNGANGSAVPGVDQTATGLNPGAPGGTITLATGTAAVDPSTSSSVVDKIGYGTSNTPEGTASSGNSVTLSIQRKATADTDNNSTDFSALAPTPDAVNGGGGTTPDPDPQPGTPVAIAAVQGTNAAASPMVGQTVTVEGVVTAMYATGGYNGFYVQTAGTGGQNDATPGASDAVFVYGGSGFTNPQGLEIGDSLKVTGPVSEFNGSTQITPAAGGIVELGTALAPVTPLAIAYPTSEAGREAQEGMLLAPTDTFTVSNTYSTNQYAEIGLATGTTPLLTPTEVADAQNATAIAAATADNAARGVVLDDGASVNFLGSATNKAIALPWLSKANPVRVGAEATLSDNGVILEYRNSTWKFQPRQQVTGAGAGTATFENTRADEAAPADVGGDISLSSFNVLNYFTQTAALAGCTSTYNDRANNPITANSCGDSGPRGAANDVNLQRQQVKIVAAINTLDASVVSLEEIENSVKFGKNRDQALATLVDALNADAGPGTWAFAPSPAAADLPALAEQDVIRNAFIYQPDEVSLVGPSEVFDSAAFDNAREPLAQGFKAAGAPDDEAFAVITNHFKSKGSGVDDGTGQGSSNPDRIAQAGDLADFADTFSEQLGGSGAVFLAGDFNSYSMEDPMQVLYADGYVNLAPEGEYTYSFSGQSGSLDHILANAAGEEMVTGSDIWNINSGEAIAFEYSRYNYNVTEFYEPNQFRASDHDPLKVGLSTATEPATVDLQLLNINDFHGRIDANTTKFATTVEQLKKKNDNTLLLSAGDNIGASLFASSLAGDQPTIEVLNALGLKTSAVGNHEFDKGFSDLTDRVIPEADFTHLGANVYEKGTTTPALDEYDIFTVGGLDVAVIGAVTDETPSLVSASGVATLDFGDPVEAVNRVATDLTDGDASNGEADVIVAEYHEGAGAGIPDGSSLEQEVAEGGVFADIVTKTSAQVDAIFTGHTHKQYAWDGQVPGAEAGTTRPIIQTGSYGEFVGQIELSIDPVTGDVLSYTKANVARAAAADTTLPVVAEVDTIVTAALAEAARVGNEPVGTIAADITTAHNNGTRDDRAAESTLGDVVANALRDTAATLGEPDLGLTNPGGLRAELLYKGDTTSNPKNTDGVVTFAEANAVLTFNNTLALVDISGADFKAVLEEQWQTNADGTVPTRPYLQLGLSDNVEITADESRARGDRITSIRVDGAAIDPAKTYSIATLSFLADGSDNFRSFTKGTKVDTGLLDIQAFRDYLEANPNLAPDFARQQVFTQGMPSSLTAGSAATFELGRPNVAPAPITGKSLDMTSLGSVTNTQVTATLVNGTTRTVLGTYPVTAGVAQVTGLTVPAATPAGATVELVATPSRTRVTLPVLAGTTTPPTTDPTPTPDPTPNPTPNPTPTPTPTPTPNPEPTPTPEEKAEATIKSFNTQGKVGDKVRFKVKVKADGEIPKGTLTAKVKGTKKVVQVKVNKKGVAIIKLPAFKNPGTKRVVLRFKGNGDVAPEKTVVKITITR